MKRVGYLDLEKSNFHSNKITLDRYSIYCNIEGNVRHHLQAKKFAVK